MDLKDWWDLKIEKPIPVVKKKRPTEVQPGQAGRPLTKESVVKPKATQSAKEYRDKYKQFSIGKKK